MAAGQFKKILIVGAGPAGLLLALLLQKHGIPVTLLEGSDKLDNQPRAAYYGPAAMPDLHRAGILEEVRERGISPTTMYWRRSDDFSIIAGMDTAVLDNVDGIDCRTCCLVLQDLLQLMYDRFVKYGGEVKWLHKVTATGQDETKAWVDADTPEGKVRAEGNYLVGCDGANSIVRRSLFGDEYPGFTWDRQIVATNVYYDFPKYGFTDANFIIHPEHFYMAARMTDDSPPLYRVTYGEQGGLTTEQLKARQPMKYEIMLPGHPKPDEYKILNIAPYRMHQRTAHSYRVGRILLAADAAHLCNPWGGMGITGGFVDIGGLYDCLAGIYDGKADESILDLYSKVRKEKWETMINPISSENFRRVHDSDPDTRLERDEFMQLCKAVEGNKVKAKELYLQGMELRYDFTQHYNKV